MLDSGLALLVQGGGDAPLWVVVLIAVLAPLTSFGATWITLKETNKREAVRRSHEWDLQAQKLRTDLRTEFMAEEAVKQLLQTEGWKLCSFGEIRKRVGGFNGDELRKLLVRSGAIRFYSLRHERMNPRLHGKPVDLHFKAATRRR